MCLAPDVGSELPVTGGMQADPSQRIAMAPGISDGGGSGDFQAPPSFGCLIMGSTLARIPSRGIALSRMARSPFPLRLPGSQHHTGFWLLKPAGYCQAPHRPQASRALPARLPPPGPVLCRRLLSWVAGATLDLCRTPSPRLSALCMLWTRPLLLPPVWEGPLGWRPTDVGDCRHPEPMAGQVSPSSSSWGTFCWLGSME